MNRWIMYLESRLDALETSEPFPATVRVFGGPFYDRLTQSLIVSDFALRIMPIFVALLAVGVMIFALFSQ